MRLFLARHGEAEAGAPDLERALSPRGREQVGCVARAVALGPVQPAAILHSGLLRARQSAEILAEALRPRQGVRSQEGLGPNDDPRIAARVAEETEGPLMLVGHLPHLSRLASLLLLGEPEREVVVLRTGAALALERDGGLWRVAWMVAPPDLGFASLGR